MGLCMAIGWMCKHDSILFLKILSHRDRDDFSQVSWNRMKICSHSMALTFLGFPCQYKEYTH